MSIGAIIVGAGLGKRLQADLPKCLIRIDNVPLIFLAALPFEQVESVAEIVLVVPPDYESDIRDIASKLRFQKIKAVVPGGRLRQDSVQNGVIALSDETTRVVIHDGARALLSISLLQSFIDSSIGHSAALAAVQVTATLHESIEGRTSRGPKRASLVEAQTPQCFDRKLLMEAFKRAEIEHSNFTDEVSLVRDILGIEAAIIPGEHSNVKITHPEDPAFFKPQLQARVDIIKGHMN